MVVKYAEYKIKKLIARGSMKTDSRDFKIYKINRIVDAYDDGFVSFIEAIQMIAMV